MYININGGGASLPTSEINARKDVQNNNLKPNNPYANTNKSAETGQVTISTAYAQLQNVESQLKKVDTINRQKVESLKLAIKQGKFKINEEAIADKLMATVKDFLLSTPERSRQK